jgi:hypothetical protein
MTGKTLTPEQAQMYLDRYGAGMIGSDWEAVNVREAEQSDNPGYYTELAEITRAFIRSEDTCYLNESCYVFSSQADYRNNPSINLNTLFDAANSGDKDVIQFIKNINRALPWEQDAELFLQGMEAGGKAGLEAADKQSWGDVALALFGGILNLPKTLLPYIKESAQSNEKGPFDEHQLKSNYVELLNLQGRPYDAGVFYAYDPVSQWKFITGSYVLPVAGAGAIKGISKLAAETGLPGLRSTSL